MPGGAEPSTPKPPGGVTAASLMEDEEDIFKYDYGDDFPEVFNEMGAALLGRPKPFAHGGPKQVLQLLLEKHSDAKVVRSRLPLFLAINHER